MRSENPIIGNGSSKGGEALDVTDRLVSFNIQYLVAGNWRDSFDSKKAKRLPKAVLVEFILREDDGRHITKRALITVGGGE